MDIFNLAEILKEEPNYRIKQIQKALFVDLIDDWTNASTLPLNLREKLNKKCPLLINGQSFESSDKSTVKTVITLKATCQLPVVAAGFSLRKTTQPKGCGYQFPAITDSSSLKDNIQIESVLMKSRDGRNTVCVSSQAGCTLNCSFCATGQSGFKRNLEVFEIIEQALFFARLLKKENEKITNIVFMGMGEPFLNYDNVLNAIKILNDKDGFNLGARHFSVSTVGIPEGIKKFSGENLQANMAISLHAPSDDLRSKIIPINKKYPIKEIISRVDEYIKKTNRRVMFEYIMIKDLNDSDECAKKLAKLMKKPLYFVNLISYNPTGKTFQSSKGERIKKFKEILEKEGITVTQRYRFGEGLNAACGQLVCRNGNIEK
ncbi:MAG: 23S rRNA (adenine(2503)-C(2))-methyltransferase RlmN [bacterium]